MTVQVDDLPPEAANSQPIGEAWLDTSPELIAEFRDLEERLRREGRWQYVGNVRNPDYSVLSEFDSHGQRLRKQQQAIFAQIDDLLMAKLRRGILSAWAREGSPVAQWRAIPSSAWQSLKLEDLQSGTLTARGVTLFDTRVGVPVKVNEPAPVPAPPSSETGAPGRPSNMHLVVSRFEERANAGQLETSLAREAATLAAWFAANHPDKQALTARTIENKIRSDYRGHTSTDQKPTKL